MRIVLILLVLILISCGPVPEPIPEPAVEKTPEPVAEYSDDSNVSDPYQRWLMNEFDIWQYLKNNPAESDVLTTLGEPDSVFMDFDQTCRILYYFIPKLSDYNSIEINVETGQVSGFEWD
ncbi:MAG: hypothetical protein KAK01_04615 [Candidatus Marinimicrobia bacterium]|nr:hypothetical protein [Candidatus Neomarinimicrobiota bacterium]